MAMFGQGGGLFGNEPADSKPEKSLEELRQELAVLQERNKNLEEQTKIQRDSFLQLNQHTSEQARMMREQLSQQVTRQHPGAIPSAPASPPASDRWEDLVNSIAGNPASAPAQSPGMPIDPNTLKAVVRQTLLEEANAVEAAQQQERQTLNNLANQFKVQYPDLANNKKFTSEVDRIYAGLKSRGMDVHQAWEVSLQEAAHIHQNYSQRRSSNGGQQQQAAPQQQPQAGLGAYLFPMGVGGPSQGARPGDSLAIDLRPPEERFKDAKAELNELQKEAARRQFGAF